MDFWIKTRVYDATMLSLKFSLRDTAKCKCKNLQGDASAGPTMSFTGID